MHRICKTDDMFKSLITNIHFSTVKLSCSWYSIAGQLTDLLTLWCELLAACFRIHSFRYASFTNCSIQNWIPVSAHSVFSIFVSSLVILVSCVCLLSTSLLRTRSKLNGKERLSRRQILYIKWKQIQIRAFGSFLFLCCFRWSIMTCVLLIFL
jgi:hypothetical protein